MGLPTTFKTYQAPVTIATTLHGNAADNAKDAVFRVFNAMISLGWVTKGSNDGVTAGMDGVNRIDVYTKWQCNLGTPHPSWHVIENGAGAQLLFIDDGDVGTDYANFHGYYSPDGGFTGGSTTVRPTAPHEVQVNMASAPFGSSGGIGDVVITAHIIASTDAVNTRVLWFRGAGAFAAGTPGIWMFDQARAAKSGWAAPNYFMTDMFGFNSLGIVGGLLNNFQNGLGESRIYTYANGVAIPSGFVGAYATIPNAGGSSGNPWSVFVTTLNGLTGLYDIFPMAIGVPVTHVTADPVRGLMGVPPDVYVMPETAPSTFVPRFPSGSTAPLSGTREWITYGDFLIPWGGGALAGDVGDFDLFNLSGDDDCVPSINTTGITAFTDHLEVTFSTDVVLSGPALEIGNWTVTVDGPGREVEVTSVSFVGNTVTLGVTPQTLDADYTLHLPTIGITSDVFGVFTGLYSLDFDGVPTIVNLQMVRAVDTHHVDVLFAIAVSEDTAGDPLNYSVNNGLTITEAVRVTDFWYRLRNEPRQTDGVNYTFIATNIEAK